MCTTKTRLLASCIHSNATYPHISLFGLHWLRTLVNCHPVLHTKSTVTAGPVQNLLGLLCSRTTRQEAEQPAKLCLRHPCRFIILTSKPVSSCSTLCKVGTQNAAAQPTVTWIQHQLSHAMTQLRSCANKALPKISA